MPAIVVGNQGQRGITNLSLTRELGFLQIRHPNYVHAPASVNFRLGLCGKSRSFHADIRATPVRLHVRNFARLFEQISQFITNGMSEGDVRYNSFTKKVDSRARARVLSKNWSGITMSSGAYCSCSEPT